MPEPPDLATQVAAYEAKLRQRAGGRAASGGDPALQDLNLAISERRQRRSAPLGVHARGGRDTAPASEPASPAPPAPPDPTPTPADTGGEPGAGAAGGRILAIEPFGPTVKVFRIGRPAGFTFRAGQYAKVGAAGGRREDFSIASAPHEPHLDLAIELRPGGKVTPALFALGVGDPVDIGEAAKGGLRLDATSTHHLMVATVTGIAPLRAMVRDALHQGTNARFTILHGASLAAELCFHDELVALAQQHQQVTYVPTVSRPEDPANRSWSGSTGRVDGLARQVGSTLDPATTAVYAVGNAGMIDAVERDLGGAGFRVHAESYGS